MSKYRLSHRADNDLLDIFVYGIEQFGVTQAETYQAELVATFENIAAYPHMGRSADSIAHGVRRHEHGSHVILYEDTNGGVLILALVHNRSVRRLNL